MTGLKIVLPISFSDSSLPILYDDAIMSTGSLILVDPAHSANPLSGVPTNGVSIPNIAWKTAAAILGSGDSSSLASTFNDGHQAADAIVERSGKGGIHGIYSKVNNTNDGRGIWIQGAAAIKTYMGANQGHSFYMSMWSRKTRIETTGHRIMQFAQGGNFNLIVQDQGFSAGTLQGSYQSPATSAVGNEFRAAAGYGSAYSTAFYLAMAEMGNVLDYNSGSAYGNKASSYILYRSYLEDLTVSGRTYAQVQAIDQALWTAAMASGGRFNGDTFTDPATFP